MNTNLIQEKTLVLPLIDDKSGKKSGISAYLNRQAWYIRLTNKEYWNANIFFIPLAFYMVYLAIKARAIFFFSAANPAIPTGGLIGESKEDINKLIPPQYRPKTTTLKQGDAIWNIRQKMNRAQLEFPAIIKPVVGCRGMMVKKVESVTDILAHLHEYDTNFLLEEFVDYPVEGAILYWKNPETGESDVQSVTLKAFLSVKGDGKSSVKELLMQNPRGVLQVERLQKEKPDLMASIPQYNEHITVEPIGNHCRGTKFLNYNYLINANMVQAYDKIQEDLEGCYVYRLDIKAPSVSDLQAGKNIKILEINGVGADPAHIFAPNTPIMEMFHAYIRLWEKIYEVATALHRQGVPYMTYKDLKKYAAQQSAVQAKTMTTHDFLFLLNLGFASSFIGTLPLSTLNLSILKLALDNRHQAALSFTYSASIVEFIQVCLTLPLLGVLASIPNLKAGFALISIPVLLFLGYKSYKTAVNTEGGKMVENDGFKQGLLLGCANVMVYPFWLLWGHVFVNNGWLKLDFASLSIFCIGAGIGTFLAFLVFVFLGKILWKRLSPLQFLINRLIALTFFGFAFLQLYNVVK
jgi:hypothetical protein